MRLYLLTLLLIKGELTSSIEQPNFLDSFLGAFRGPGGFNVTQALSAFKMPSCLSHCVPQIDDLFKTASMNVSQSAALSSLCSNLQAATDCAVKAGCSEVYSKAATNAFEVVCLQNVEAFAESFECLKTTAVDMQPECERRCDVNKDILDKASDNRISQIFDSTSMCNSTTCLLHCFQDGLNKKCLGSSMLVEKFMSTIVSKDSAIGEEFSWMLPEICRRQSFPLPEKISLDRPLSVGTPSQGLSRLLDHVQRVQEDQLNADKPNTLETSLFVDNEVRTLQCSMFDWQGRAVPMPDYESLAVLMMKQMLPLYTSIPKGNVHLASEKDFIEAEQRVSAMEEVDEILATSEEPPRFTQESSTNGVETELDIPNGPTWRHVEDGLIIPVDSCGYGSLLLVIIIVIAVFL